MTEGIDIGQKYLKLAAIVDTCLDVDLDLSVAHYFQKYLTVAKRYVMELKTAHAQDVKTVLLEISDTLTAPAPVDFVNWVCVAEPWGQYIRTLGVNSELSLTDRDSSSEWIYTGAPDQLPNGTDLMAYGGYELANYGGRALFSIGGGLPSKGFFRVRKCDDGRKEFMFDIGVVASDRIYLEYISYGFNPCGETILNPFESVAVTKAMVHHFEKTRKDGGKSEAAIQRTGQELYHAECVVRASRNDLSPDTVVQITRKYFRLTNKI